VVELARWSRDCATRGWRGPRAFFVDRERSLVERLRLGVATFAVVERSQVVKRLCNIRMVGIERFLTYRQRLLEHRLGVDTAALVHVDRSEVANIHRDNRMIERREEGGGRREESMNLQRRYFLLVVTLTSAAATPVLGQVAAPTVAPASSGTESAASIPDLSGIWGRWFTFELPSSGPGPVVSKLRRPDGTMILSVVGDYANPILRPEAAATVKKIGEMELSGTVLPNPHNQCWPEPTPFTLSIQLGMQLIPLPYQIDLAM
jgi:hypothetical protein